MKRTPLAIAVAVVLTFSGCLGGGTKHFREGDQAYQRGDLAAADRAYTDGLAKDPNNTKYKEAQKKVRAEMAKEHKSEAIVKEKAGEWEAASAAWGRAAELDPDNADFAVRRDLSSAKAKNLGPDAWYEAALKVDAANSGNKIAERSLAGARAAAYKHHLDLAEGFLASGEGGRAYEHFTRAKQIDPTTPGMRTDSFVRAEALSMAEQAEQKANGGDAIGAYELYQQAYVKMPLPEIKKKLDRVKRKASAVLAKLEKARREADRGRYGRALSLYESVIRGGAVPANIRDEVTAVRAQLLKEKAQTAKKYADRNNLSRAHRALEKAIGVAGLDQVSSDVLRAALDLVKDGEPGKAREAIDNAKLEEDSPLYEAAQAYALAGARKNLKSAERLKKRDPARALRIVAQLDPFEDELPGVAALRRELRKGSFADLLDDALREAKRGKDGEAASLLLAALNASAAPDTMRTPAQKGADALKVGSYADAERAFNDALAAAPRSRLAQRGIDIARLRRKAAEKVARDTLVSGRGNAARAVDVLAAGLELEPANAHARAAVDGLVKRIDNSSSLSDAEVADLVAYANKLSGVSAKASSQIEEGAESLRQGDLPAAEQAFGAALAAAPSARVAEAARKASKKRMLTSLASDVAGVAKGDEATAESLAELLKRDPNSPQAKAALKSLLDGARRSAKNGDDGEAARLLKLAAIATSPAPGVKAALDKGSEAMSAGKMGDAESAYGDALDLEPTQSVAKAGFDIAKNARVAMLSGAIAQAKEGKNLDAAREALERTLKMDPNSTEARKAFNELLDEADRQGTQGNDAQAAALLGAANAVSKPATAKSAIAKANGLLGKKDYDGAVAGYEGVLKTGDSKVASRGLAIAKKRRIKTLAEATEGLRNGADEKRGAKAVASLRTVDPAHPAVSGAVAAALSRAEQSAAAGNDAAAAATLTAVAEALDEVKQTKKAISLLAAGKYGEAEVMFGKTDSTDLTRMGATIARGRKMGTLTKDLSRGGSEAALAIQALLKADPNNKEAKRAFESFLVKAKSEAAKGNDKAAAEQLTNANIAAGATDDLTSTIKVGIEHFAESRYAEAERAFDNGLEIAKTSAVAQTGKGIASDSRKKQERAAMSAIAKNGDPRPHAKVLGASLIVEPKSSVVSKAFADLLKRAERSAQRGADNETAQELEAAVLLENKGMDTVKSVTDASALYAKASFEDAQEAFSAIVAGQNGDGSRVAKLGEKLALERRVALLRAKFDSAVKAKDVLSQAELARAILKLDPNDRAAKRAAQTLQGKVKSSRVATAKTNEEQGKLGVAYLYYERALELDDADRAAKDGLAAIKEKMKKRTDLILVVDSIVREDSVKSTDCKGFDPILREEIMKATSRRTDLGAYVLSPNWTEAWKKKDDRAPEVSGSIRLTTKKCRIYPATGEGTYVWEILTPVGGTPAAKGEFKATLPRGTIPRDEQDGKANNARKAFGRYVASVIGDAIENSRDTVDLWLLTLAEHGIKNKDSVLVADAYARLRVLRPASIDPDRMKKVETFLSEQYR